MATSDTMLMRPRRFHHVLPSLLLCLAWLVVHQLSFVQGVAWDGTRAAQRQVAQRFSRQSQPTRRELDADGKAEAKRLTSSINQRYSAEKLIEVLDGAVDGPIFNFYHASAAYTQLQRLKWQRDLQPRDWDSPVLLRLHDRVEDMAMQDQLNEQASANILWSLAHLSERFSMPTQLLAALVKSVPTKVKDMKPQELSNIFWASAKAKDVEPIVLDMVSAIVAQIPGKAQDMKPQALSNCLFACAQLKDEVPKVSDIVSAIVGEIPVKLQGMKPQEMSNSLEALVLLRDSAPEVAGFLAAGGNFNDILRSAAARLNILLPRLFGKDFGFTVPVVVWACAKAGVYDGELLDSVAMRLGSRSKLSALPGFGVCALSWSYEVLEPEDDFKNFKTQLRSETAKRGFNEADVESCQRGRSGWNCR